MADKPSVGVFGLGIIGAQVAGHLREAGYRVAVWNRTPRAEEGFRASPAEVAAECSVLQLFVADAEAVFSTLEACGDVLGPQHVVVCSATIGHEATMKAAAMAQARGARFLDAPFTGSRGAAQRRQLVYYVAGEQEAFALARPVLEASSRAVVHLDRVGDAAVVKVATNLIAAVSVQALAEAFALCQKAGVDVAQFTAALAENACRSGTMDLKLPKMVQGDYEPHFSLKHMSKDVQLALSLARQLGVDAPATECTGELMLRGLSHGWGDLDFAALFQTYGEPAPGGDDSRKA